MIERTEHAHRGHRHAGRRVPRPVDDGLRAGRRPDRAAPPRWRAGRPAEHGLPGHDRVRDPAASRRRAARSTSRSARSGSPRATPSRSCTRCRRSSAPTTTGRPSGRPTLFRPPRREDRPDVDQGSRAREAVHEHVAVHEVRGREPVLHDRATRPAWTTRTSCARSARTTRAPRTCRAPASPPARACSRTRCSSRRSRPTTSRWARRRCRSTRACPPTSWRRSSAATAALAGQDRRHPRHGVQGRVGRHPRVALLQAPQAPVVGRRARPVHRPVRPGRSPDDRSTASSRRATSSSSARRTSAYRDLEIGGKDVVDVWGALGRGDPALMRILVTGAAGFINGYLVPELLEAGHEVDRPRRLLEVRAPDQVVRRPPVLPLRRGRRQGRRAPAASWPPTSTRSSPPPR